MIRAVFFDIDGTVMSHSRGCVPESTREALRLLKEKGILIFTATGRYMAELKDLPLDGLDFDGYVTLNGQICTDRSGRVLHAVPVCREDTQTLTEMFNSRKLPLMIFERERMYVNFIDDRVRRTQADISSPLPETGAYSGGEVYQFVAFVNEQESRELAGLLKQCAITRWNRHGVDIIPKDSGKVQGIQKILEIYGIHKDECMAFGDGENDIDMLQFAGVGIAMGNADETVKAAADYVTDDVDCDGIMNALVHYDLLDYGLLDAEM